MEKEKKLLEKMQEKELEDERKIYESTRNTLHSKKLTNSEISLSSQRLFDDAKRKEMKLDSMRLDIMIENKDKKGIVRVYDQMLKESGKKELPIKEEREISASRYKKKTNNPKYNFGVNYFINIGIRVMEVGMRTITKKETKRKSRKSTQTLEEYLRFKDLKALKDLIPLKLLQIQVLLSRRSFKQLGM